MALTDDLRRLELELRAAETQRSRPLPLIPGITPGLEYIIRRDRDHAVNNARHAFRNALEANAPAIFNALAA